MGSRLEKNSAAVSKAIESHQFHDEKGEEYEASGFGGFSDYFRRKKIKLQNLDVDIRARSGDKPQIFKGIVVHVNGYTQPSLNDLHQMIVSHGGGFIQYLDGKTQVTHIVASNLTPKKAEEFKRYRIVKPAWIVESVNAGKQLPWNSYRLVDEGASQKVLHFDNGNITSEVNEKQRGYRYQTETSWYTKQLSTNSDTSTNAQLPTPNESSPSKRVALEKEQNVDLAESQAELPHKDTVGPEHLSEPQDTNVQDTSNFSFRQLEGLSDADIAQAIPPLPTIQSPSVKSEDAVEDLYSAPEHMAPQNHKRKDSSPSEPLSAKKAKMTAEEHNSVLLSDPRIRKSSVLNPEFLEQYYRESRLHHLSFWRADLKSQIQAITAAQSSTQRAKQKRAPHARRYILHSDFDSFFVSVSLKNHPQYVDKPACVAHGSGNNSEIASCNYVARQFGIKNGMWMKRATELCKDLKVLPYDFPAYEAASKVFYDAIMATDGIVQSISVDEALVDITASCLQAGGTDGTVVREGCLDQEQAEAEKIAKHIRDKVLEGSGCNVSVGIGSNILLAKTALRKAKPAGQYQVKPEDVLDFLADLPVRDLPGVAYSIGGKLEDEGIKLVKDIRECTKERLMTVLGPKTGEKIWNYSRGIDKTEVGDPSERKSVSAEVNWGVRFETSEQAEEFVDSLCRELHSRLMRERVKGKQLTMKIMRRSADAPLDPPKHLGHGKCDTFNKSVSLGVSTNEHNILTREALSILRHYGFPPGELRGLGVQMTKLEPLKASNAKEVADGSQKRLQFKTKDSPPAANQREGQDSTNIVESAKQSPAQKPLSFKPATGSAEKSESKDPIQDDVETPKKKRISHFLQGMPESNSPSRKPLNTSGTQFVFPTQVDPSVMAELPADIRSKLESHMNQKTINDVEPDHIEGREEQDALSETNMFPDASQIDPEILNELPADVRAEVLAHYSSTKKHSGQAILPQSPRKDRTIVQTRKPTSSKGRPRGGGSFLRPQGAQSRLSTLTQSNFVAKPQGVSKVLENHESSEEPLPAEISEDFLAALPEDIRREILAEHRAEQLKRNAGLEVSGRKGGGGGSSSRASKFAPSADSASDMMDQAQSEIKIINGESEDAEEEESERYLVLPKRAERPGFTSAKLSRLDELRDAVSQWVEEFRDEGPYQEDVEALGKYLQSVVCTERDMNKAVAVTKWMSWVIRNVDADQQRAEGATKWAEALESTKQLVQDAVKSRGLGEVQF